MAQLRRYNSETRPVEYNAVQNELDPKYEDDATPAKRPQKTFSISRMSRMRSSAATYSSHRRRATTSQAQVLWEKLLIHPRLRSKICWDWLLILLVLYVAAAIPIYAALDLRLLVMHGMDVFVDIIFWLDILVNFNTTFLTATSRNYETNDIDIDYNATDGLTDFTTGRVWVLDR